MARSKCGQRARPSTSFVGNAVDLLWRNFLNPQRVTKLQSPLFWEIHKDGNTMENSSVSIPSRSTRYDSVKTDGDGH